MNPDTAPVHLRDAHQPDSPHSGTFPYASVVIPVYNNRDGLTRTLEALERQTYPSERFEIIVVDNGSEEGCPIMRSDHPRVTWLCEPERGSYRARNRAIRSASGEVIAFTDSDCIPQPDWIASGVRAVQAGGNVGLVAGRIEIVFRDDQHVTISELYDSLSWMPQHEAIATARFGATANLFTTRRTLTDVGCFDDRLLSGGDREWGNRVFRAGLRQVYSHETVVFHPARHTLRQLIDRSLRVTVSSMVAGPDAGYSSAYVRRHLIERPRVMWRRMARGPTTVGVGQRMTVLGLYFGLKLLQLLERVRVHWGTPRR